MFNLTYSEVLEPHGGRCVWWHWGRACGACRCLDVRVCLGTAVSNTAIAPSSSLLPPLSSRRSAGARRVATAARAAAATAVALSPP